MGQLNTYNPIYSNDNRGLLVSYVSGYLILSAESFHQIPALIARLMGPTWGPSGAGRAQVAPMLAPWTLLYERWSTNFKELIEMAISYNGMNNKQVINHRKLEPKSVAIDIIVDIWHPSGTLL